MIKSIKKHKYKNATKKKTPKVDFKHENIIVSLTVIKPRNV